MDFVSDVSVNSGVVIRGSWIVGRYGRCRFELGFCFLGFRFVLFDGSVFIRRFVLGRRRMSKGFEVGCSFMLRFSCGRVLRFRLV